MPHQLGQRERIVIAGPEVMVKPAAALALGLVMHELATNAVKYGSLSVPKGRVAINWSIKHQSLPLLVLQWSKSNGPPAKAPTRQGFGTKLIEQELKHTLGGEREIRLRRERIPGDADHSVRPQADVVRRRDGQLSTTSSGLGRKFFACALP